MPKKNDPYNPPRKPRIQEEPSRMDSAAVWFVIASYFGVIAISFGMALWMAVEVAF